ncbi:MAG: sulfur oxidation protein SoxY [Burkholderiales bacterium]|jgi:sulfur-oxidizing protein SoxY|nr:sulfur oxidation protein SoxY [Burkholderiales bacterium]
MNLRRRLLWALGLGWGISPSVFAQHVPQEQLLQPYVGVNALQKGRVKLEIARLADNGFNVPLKVSVASPMTTQEHVRRLLLLSNRNPRPLIAAFEFGPSSDQVLISTRVRLGGSQTVYALAQTSDGIWWLDTAEVEVTESACLDQT